MPNAAKVRHITNHPRVSLNPDSDGNGAGIVVVGGDATVDAGRRHADDEQYLTKYGDTRQHGLTEEISAPTPLG